MRQYHYSQKPHFLQKRHFSTQNLTFFLFSSIVIMIVDPGFSSNPEVKRDHIQINGREADLTGKSTSRGEHPEKGGDPIRSYTMIGASGEAR